MISLRMFVFDPTITFPLLLLKVFSGKMHAVIDNVHATYYSPVFLFVRCGITLESLFL